MYPITIAVTGCVEAPAELLDLAREYAFALGESTVCINAIYALSNMNPEFSDRASTEFRELLLQANRMGICNLMLSE